MSIKDLLKKWKNAEISKEIAIGHILQHIYLVWAELEAIKSPPKSPDDKERQKRKRRRVLAWQKELRATQKRFKDIDWLLSAWLRGLLSDEELNRNVDDLLDQANLLEWSSHVGMQVGFLSSLMDDTGKQHQRLSELIQLMSILRAMYELVRDSNNVEHLRELRLSLLETYARMDK